MLLTGDILVLQNERSLFDILIDEMLLAKNKKFDTKRRGKLYKCALLPIFSIKLLNNFYIHTSKQRDDIVIRLINSHLPFPNAFVSNECSSIFITLTSYSLIV